ncbi:hypothetical protein AAVH_06271 [Aphelenchoides avenae]|nr:hypothetical protein AAVH_06271 [Aphelenchus avenae]
MAPTNGAGWFTRQVRLERNLSVPMSVYFRRPKPVSAPVDKKMKRVFEEIRKYHLLYDPDDALFKDESAREHVLNQLATEFSMPDLQARWSDVFEHAKNWRLTAAERFHLKWLAPFVRQINAREKALQQAAKELKAAKRRADARRESRDAAFRHMVALSYESDDDGDPQRAAQGQAQRYTWTDTQASRAFAEIRKRRCLYDPRHCDDDSVKRRADAWKHVSEAASLPNPRILWRTVFETKNANLLTIAPWYQRRLSWLQPYLPEIAEHKRKKKGNLYATEPPEPVEVKPPTSKCPPGPKTTSSKRTNEATEPAPSSKRPPEPTSAPAERGREATEPADIKPPISKRPLGPTPTSKKRASEAIEPAPPSKRPPEPTSTSTERGREATEPAEVKPRISKRLPGPTSKPLTSERSLRPTSSPTKRLRVDIKRDPDSTSHQLPLAPSQRRVAVNQLFDV